MLALARLSVAFSLDCGFEDLPFTRLRQGSVEAGLFDLGKAYWTSSRVLPSGYDIDWSAGWRLLRDWEPGTRMLFEMVPINQKLFVQCSSPLSGDAAMALCTVACDACGRCAADAATGLVRMDDNLPLVDYSAGGPALPEATYRCPTGAIQWLEGAQFADGEQSKSQSETRYAQLR